MLRGRGTHAHTSSRTRRCGGASRTSSCLRRGGAATSAPGARRARARETRNAAALLAQPQAWDQRSRARRQRQQAPTAAIGCTGGCCGVCRGVATRKKVAGNLRRFGARRCGAAKARTRSAVADKHQLELGHACGSRGGSGASEAARESARQGKQASQGAKKRATPPRQRASPQCARKARTLRHVHARKRHGFGRGVSEWQNQSAVRVFHFPARAPSPPALPAATCCVPKRRVPRRRAPGSPRRPK